MVKLIINVVAIFLGLAIFLVIANTPFGKKNEKYQYAFAAASLLLAVAIGALLKFLFM